MAQAMANFGVNGAGKALNEDIVPARAFHEKADRALFRAFAYPSGILGRIAGFMMSKKNMMLNRAAVEILNPTPGDDVLEIGFGPGKGLELLLDSVGSEGSVAGVDVSMQMVAVASRRNMGALAGGSMRLLEAGAHKIPWPNESFNGVLSVSNVQFWNPASTSFSEVLRVLKPGGVFTAAIHTMAEGQKKMTPGLYPEEIQWVLGSLGRAGFTEIETHEISSLENELCISAVRPKKQQN